MTGLISGLCCFYIGHLRCLKYYTDHTYLSPLDAGPPDYEALNVFLHILLGDLVLTHDHEPLHHVS
jgi:hypothetical protein